MTPFSPASDLKEQPNLNNNDTTDTIPQTSYTEITPHSSRFSSSKSRNQQNTSKKRKNCNSIDQKKQELLDLAHKTLSNNNVNTEEEYDIVGKRIGYQLKDVEGFQRIIAEKLISDVMFYAKMGKLTEHSSIFIPPNSRPQPIHPSAQFSQQPQGYVPNSGYQSQATEGSTHTMLSSQVQNSEENSHISHFFNTYEP